jgi:hypothetical protein
VLFVQRCSLQDNSAGLDSLAARFVDDLILALAVQLGSLTACRSFGFPGDLRVVVVPIAGVIVNAAVVRVEHELVAWSDEPLAVAYLHDVGIYFRGKTVAFGCLNLIICVDFVFRIAAL